MDKLKKVHFIGIGGIGVSALAEIFYAKAAEISGSDMNSSKITEKFKNRGHEIHYNHLAENVKDDVDLVIYSPAIPENNPELLQAKMYNIPIMSYPEALGALCEDYFTIAVAGTHGKSTTTAMISLIMEKAGLDPTVVIGTLIPEFGAENFRIGKSKYLVIEACEYRESFTHLSPDILVITNAEADHLDYYKTAENYFAAFKKVIEKTKETIIINSAQKDLVKDSSANIVEWNEASYTPGVAGDFNKENATHAANVAKVLKIDETLIIETLKNFKGTWRRMETKQTSLADRKFIDDYGHHPTEIQKTLDTIRNEHPEANIVCVFQPHQYSRTHHFLNDFAKSFENVDQVVIPDIYRVRDKEEDIKKVSPEDLVDEINKNSNNARFGNGIENTADYIKNNHFDVIVTMGAGNITDIYNLL